MMKLPCQNCGHDAEEIGDLLWWCQRCGCLTLQYEKGGNEHREPWVIQRSMNLSEAVRDYLSGLDAISSEVNTKLEESERAVRECWGGE
jgi:hypothetical protein